MRKIISLMLVGSVIVFLPSIGVIANPEQLRISVVDFESIGTQSNLGIAIAENLRAALMKSDEFYVISRDHLVQLMRDRQMTLSNLRKAEVAVEIGRMAGARLILVGSVSKVGPVCSFSYRLLDVVAGTVSQAQTFQNMELEDVPAIIEQIPLLILGKRAFVIYNTYQLTSMKNYEVLESVLLKDDKFCIAYTRFLNGTETEGYVKVFDDNLNFLEEVRITSDWPEVSPKLLFSDGNASYVYLETSRAIGPRTVEPKTKINIYDSDFKLLRGIDHLRRRRNRSYPFSVLCYRDEIRSFIPFGDEWLAL